MRHTVFAIAIILICATGGPLSAQNTAEIRGVVSDATGAVLPGVSLTLTHKASNQERQLITDSNGNYVFASLPNGDYLLKAELSGFKARIRDGMTLQVGQRINVDLSLEVGGLREEVTVTEATPLMRTSNAEISEVIENQRLVDLPLNGRPFGDETVQSFRRSGVRIPCGNIQCLQFSQFRRRAGPDRLYSEFRPAVQCGSIASGAIWIEADVLGGPLWKISQKTKPAAVAAF
jgi:hypothetical protein